MRFQKKISKSGRFFKIFGRRMASNKLTGTSSGRTSMNSCWTMWPSRSKPNKEVDSTTLPLTLQSRESPWTLLHVPTLKQTARQCTRAFLASRPLQPPAKQTCPSKHLCLSEKYPRKSQWLENFSESHMRYRPLARLQAAPHSTDYVADSGITTGVSACSSGKAARTLSYRSGYLGEATVITIE